MHPNMIRDNENLNLLSFDDIFKVYPSGYKFTAKFRRLLWRDSGKMCAYCGSDIETHMDMQIDHFIPKSKELNDHVSNLICSCPKCNHTKRHNDIEEFRFNFSVSKSILAGVVQPNIVKKIMDAGVNLPIEIKTFYYEKVLLNEFK